MKPIVLRNRVSVGELEVQKIHKKPEKQIVEEMYQEDKVRMEKEEKKQVGNDDVAEMKNEVSYFCCNNNFNFKMSPLDVWPETH